MDVRRRNIVCTKLFALFDFSLVSFEYSSIVGYSAVSNIKFFRKMSEELKVFVFGFK